MVQRASALPGYVTIVHFSHVMVITFDYLLCYSWYKSHPRWEGVEDHTFPPCSHVRLRSLHMRGTAGSRRLMKIYVLSNYRRIETYELANLESRRNRRRCY